MASAIAIGEKTGLISFCSLWRVLYLSVYQHRWHLFGSCGPWVLFIRSAKSHNGCRRVLYREFSIFKNNGGGRALGIYTPYYDFHFWTFFWTCHDSWFPDASAQNFFLDINKYPDIYFNLTSYINFGIEILNYKWSFVNGEKVEKYNWRQAPAFFLATLESLSVLLGEEEVCTVQALTTWNIQILSRHGSVSNNIRSCPDTAQSKYSLFVQKYNLLPSGYYWVLNSAKLWASLMGYRFLVQSS